MGAEIYEIGNTVKCFQQPLYWDEWENSDNPDGYDELDLVESNSHPGFCQEMYEMIGNTYEITEIHPYHPWVMLTDNEGADWWWHKDWIHLVKQTESLTEADLNSKYYKVILKIKRMQDKRVKNGYAF